VGGVPRHIFRTLPASFGGIFSFQRRPKSRVASGRIADVHLHDPGPTETAMKLIRIAFCITAFVLCAASAVFAQDTGTFTGTVHDSTGAIVAGADVTVSNQTVGVNKTVTTNADGSWVTPYLTAGPYDITVSAKGFKKYEAKGVVLRVGQTAKVDTTLEIGTVTSEVTVVGTGLAQVETESAQVGGVVTGTEITQLQLNGRDFAQLITLTPGVNNQTGQDEGTVGIAGNTIF
jgi:hypothetical protein